MPLIVNFDGRGLVRAAAQVPAKACFTGTKIYVEPSMIVVMLGSGRMSFGSIGGSGKLWP